MHPLGIDVPRFFHAKGSFKLTKFVVVLENISVENRLVRSQLSFLLVTGFGNKGIYSKSRTPKQFDWNPESIR